MSRSDLWWLALAVDPYLSFIEALSVRRHRYGKRTAHGVLADRDCEGCGAVEGD